MKALKLLSILCSASILAPASHAQQFLGPGLNSVEIWVSQQTDSNANSGLSRAAPVQTLTQALVVADANSVLSPVTINVLPGTYGGAGGTVESFPLSVPAYGLSFEAIDDPTLPGSGSWTINGAGSGTDVIDVTNFFFPSVLATNIPASALFMSFGAGIDALGNIVVPPSGNTIGNVVVSAPVGDFVSLLMCPTMGIGPVNQNLIVTPFGNALVDSANSTTILSGVVPSSGLLTFTLSMPNLQFLLEGDIYLQAAVFDPTRTWLTNRLRVETNP